MADDELKLRLSLENLQYKRAWADVRVQTAKDLSNIRSTVATQLAQTRQIAAQNLAGIRQAAATNLGQARVEVARQMAAIRVQMAKDLTEVRRTTQTSFGSIAAIGGIIAAAVGAAVASFTVLMAALQATINLFERLLDRGLAYNSLLEQTQLGIAAVIASLADLQTAQGRKLEGPEALNVALALARDQLQKLKVDAVNTTATFEQIAPAFQAAIGPGVRAGLTLDQIRETVVRITQAAGAIGLPFNQLNQEVRAILEGTINEDARLAKILGISNEMVKNWKEQGTLADELNKRLAQFGAAGEKAATTFAGLTSNLQEALNVFTGEATDRAFGVLKDRMARLLPQLFDFKAAGIDRSFQVLAEIIDDIFVRVVNVAGDVVEQIVAGVKSIARFLAENRSLVDAILQTGEDIVRTVIQLIRQFVVMVGATTNWRSVLELTLGTLRTIQAIIASFEPQIRAAAFATNLLLAGLVAMNPALKALGAAGTAGPRSAADVAASVLAQAEGGIAALQAALTTVKGRPTAGGAGKGSKAADQARRERLRQLEEEEKAIEETYKRQTDTLKREFDLQLTSSRTFTQGIIDAATERFEGLQAVLNRELAQAKKQSERDKINNEILKAERERDEVIQEARDAQNKREIEALKRHREALLDLQDEYDAQAIASIEARAELEGSTYEKAEADAFKIQTEAFTRRLQAARDDEAAFYRQQKDINDANVELAREYSDRIAAIIAEQEAAQDEHYRRLDAARQRDLERQRKYQNELFDLQKTYEEQDREAKRREIERASRSPFAQVRIQAISARVALEVDEINRHERLTEKRLNDDEAAAKRDYERRNQDIKNTREYYDSLLLIEENYEALRKQNKDRADQERRDSTESGGREAQREQELENPLSARSLFGDRYADISNTFSPLVAAIDSIKTHTLEAFAQMGAAFGSMVEQWVLTGKLGAGGVRSFVASALASLAKMFVVQSLAELAYGIAALTPWGAAIYGPAPFHFKASALLAGAAAASAVIGRAVAGGQGAAGGVGAAGRLADGGGSSGGDSDSGYEDYRTKYLREQAEKDKNTVREDRRGEASSTSVTVPLIVDGRELGRAVLNHLRDGGDLRDGFRNTLGYAGG